MCGIFGYVGKKNSVEIAINGLKRLEYRGYDSAGIAGIKDHELIYCKEVGKVAILEKMVDEKQLKLDIAIAHTRWATHGKPNEVNAHPHFDAKKNLALVHNGIIENHDLLRKQLQEKGIKFRSETDTEVIAQLIGLYYEGDLLKAVQKTIPQLKGAFAIALIHRDHPDQIIAVAHECPLVIGISAEEAFLSSDSHAFAAHIRDVVFISDSEIAVVKADKLEIFNSSMEPILVETEQLSIQREEISKGGYEHFTLKEIHEQPQSIRNALLSRYLEDYGTSVFEELNFDVNELLAVERILILACGTSWHAGYVASYLIEDMARIPVQVEISSEFRYKNPIVPHGTFVIAISQSGETADTLAAFRELKAKGAKVLGICNVYGSTLSREADSTLFLKAGPEIGVCSTKAFISQVTVLSLVSLLLARMRHMSKNEGQAFIQSLKILPEQAQKVLNQSKHIHALAKKYARYQNFFYLGRRYMYPTALEGALKLKEISYINANGYPAGELKHGPIALINEDCPSVAFCANKMTADKLLSNLMEIKARSGKVIAIAEEGYDIIKDIADDIIWVPETIDEIATIPSTIAAQLFAYYVAYERGEDIDRPRNLAKSVTVE
jgi:glucosamine--fructose-6-phosphate aminotransferase (isomerizing)